MRPFRTLLGSPFFAPSVALIIAAIPALTGAQALFLGLALSVGLKTPLPASIKLWNPRLLGLAIVLMGAATPFQTVLEQGSRGLWISALQIAAILGVGILLTRALKMDHPTGTLISSGTAICGGSAIAATGPAIGAGSEPMGIAVAVVFLLNAVSVVIFPPLGHFLALSAEEFGRFAALAIHDTSSVLAASVAYGGGAELTAVPMKLARALWIVPMAALLGWRSSRNATTRGTKGSPIPWFIPGFVLSAAGFSAIEALAPLADITSAAGKRLLVAALFLIGNAISAEALKRAGLRPLLLGVLLWGFAIAASLALLKFT